MQTLRSSLSSHHLALVAAAVVAVLGLGGATVAFSQSAAPAAAPAATLAKPSLTVTRTQPQRQTWPDRLSANGSVAAWQEAIVGAETNGLRIASVKVSVGDRVAVGQVLASFDSATLQADLAVVRAQLAEAQAALSEARANAERARVVQASGALSASQINQLLTAETTAAARVQATQAQIAAHEVRIRQTELRAPDAGIVSARMATIGAVPGPGQELFRLIRQGRLEWRGEVTAAELPRIKTGMTVQLRGAGHQTAPGKVRLIAPTVDPQTRNALVYVDMTRGQSAGLLPGMFARGEFEVGRSDALVVPQASIVMRDGFAQVAVLPAGVADNAVAKVNLRKVDLGRRNGEWVEVVQGLDEKAQVVVTGAGFLNDGDTVRVVATPAAPQAAGAAAKPAASGVSTPQAATK